MTIGINRRLHDGTGKINSMNDMLKWQKMQDLLCIMSWAMTRDETAQQTERVRKMELIDSIMHGSY